MMSGTPASRALSIAIRSALGSTRTESVASSTGRARVGSAGRRAMFSWRSRSLGMPCPSESYARVDGACALCDGVCRGPAEPGLGRLLHSARNCRSTREERRRALRTPPAPAPQAWSARSLVPGGEQRVGHKTQPMVDKRDQPTSYLAGARPERHPDLAPPAHLD